MMSGAMNNSVLEVKDLTKIYRSFSLWQWRYKKSFIAVDTISFNLHKGEILGLLGPNGAGKTTTLHMLLDILQPTSGTISYFGTQLARNRAAILNRIGFATSYMKMPQGLTIAENLDIYAKLYGISYAERKKRIKNLLNTFGMWSMKDKIVGELSAGQTTRVMLAKAFIAHPEIVLLDEPTAALDPDIAHEIRQFIIEQKNNYQTAVLIASHNMQEVTEICDRVIVMKQGTIIASDTPERLAASVATARISLMVGDGLKRTIDYAEKHSLNYSVYGRYIQIAISEKHIAQLLIDLANKEVFYTQIWIDKPTLEDYFLDIAKHNEVKE